MSNLDLPAWYYVLAVVFCAALCGLPWLLMWLEDRADQRDREAWADVPGATR